MQEPRRRWPSWQAIRAAARATFRSQARFQSDLALWADVRAFPPLAVILGLNCVAAMLLLRDFLGGPALKVTNIRLCIAAAAIAALGMAGRWWLSKIELRFPPLWMRILFAAGCTLPSVALLILTTERHSNLAVGLVSALTVATGAAAICWKRGCAARAASTSKPGDLPQSSPNLSPEPVAAIRSERPEMPRSPSSPVLAMQEGKQAAGATSLSWMRRTLDAAGAEQLQGVVTARFSEHQATTAVHIPFCPPFDRSPEFKADVAADSGVRIKSTAIYPYGARLELKRSGEPDAAVDVRVEFCTTAASPLSRAA